MLFIYCQSLISWLTSKMWSRTQLSSSFDLLESAANRPETPAVDNNLQASF